MHCVAFQYNSSIAYICTNQKNKDFKRELISDGTTDSKKKKKKKKKKGKKKKKKKTK